MILGHTLPDNALSVPAKSRLQQGLCGIDSLTQHNQVLLLARKIRMCGTNVTESLDLLRNGLPPLPTGSLRGDEALLLYEPAYLETLGVISQSQRSSKSSYQAEADMYEKRYRFRTALHLYMECPTEACRSRTISICGYSAEGYSTALDLLRKEGKQPPSIQSSNAALAACAAAKDWNEALDILLHEMPERTTLSCNIVLKAMERAKQGHQARELLQRMIRDRHQHSGQGLPSPDRNSFHMTMNALISDTRNAATNVAEIQACANYSNVDAAFNLLNTMQSLDRWYTLDSENSNTFYSTLSVRPDNTTFDLLASAYGRVGDWDMSSLVESLRYQRYAVSELSQQNDTGGFPNPLLRRSTITNEQSSNRNSPLLLQSENDKLVMEKNTKKRYWKFGRYEDPTTNFNLTVALQPNRYPSKNGIKILLVDTELAKVGFLLMINDVNEAGAASSTLLGLFLEHGARKRGLSKIAIAIWLDLCRRARMTPRTGVIHKPLLALVLQHTFGFQPEGDAADDCKDLAPATKRSGVLVEVSRGHDGAVELYAPSVKSLEGAFSFWDLKRENIRILKDLPSPRGRRCRVGATLTVGDDFSIDDEIDLQVAGKSGQGTLVYNSMGTCWRQVLLGTKTSG